jgi:integrase
LAAGSRETYHGQLEHFRQEFGAAMVAQFTTKHANLLMDRLADRPAAANNLRDRLNVLMKFAISIGWIETNPITLSKRVKHRTKGYRTWSEEDIAAFRKRWSLGTPQRLAMEILLNTGLRRSDAVRLGRQHITMTPEGEVFVLTTVKSGHRTELEIPIIPDLRPALATAPADQLTYIVTAQGAPRSPKAFTGWIKDAARAAGLPPDSSPHGLRKAACRRLAEANCTPHQIMAITGHRALKEIETYTREASRKLLARQAMGRLVSAFPGAGTAGTAGGQQTENTSPAKVTTRPDGVVNPDDQVPEKTGRTAGGGGGSGIRTHEGQRPNTLSRRAP